MKTIFILYFATIAFALFGWGSCIHKFIQCDFDSTKTSYKSEIIYGVGTFVPVIGVFIGYMNVGEG